MAYNSALRERLLSRIKIVDDCWIWQGSIGHRDGYGAVYVRRSEGGNTDNSKQVHRVSYEIFRGEIPKGLVLDHLCRTRACINPVHLEPVTHRDNLHRGLTLNALNSSKTHCINGHEFSNEQSQWYRVRGFRRCRECHNETEKLRHRVKKLVVA